MKNQSYKKQKHLKGSPIFLGASKEIIIHESFRKRKREPES